MTDEEILQAKAFADAVLADIEADDRALCLAAAVYALTGALADECNAHAKTRAYWVTL